MILASTRLRDATEALMASTARIDELKKKFDENPRRYFAPLANEFRKSGDIEQAIMICEEFLPQQPGHMSGHIVYGQALYESGRLPESRTVFESALGLDPENLIALRHLGDIARSEHDPAAARGWYVRVLDADPRNEDIQSLIAGLDGPDAPAEGILLEAGDAPSGSSAKSTRLGFEIEKDALPFDKLPTREVVATPFDQLPTREVVAMPFDRLPTREVVAMPFDQLTTLEVPARPFIDPSLADTAPLGVPIIPAAPDTPPPQASNLIDGFGLHGFDEVPAPAHGDHASAPTEGLEYTEFEPPTEQPAAAELDASLDSGVPSFEAPEHHIDALEGLEGSGGHPHAINETQGRAAEVDLEPLDLEGGLIFPSEDAALASSAVAEANPEGLDEPAPRADLLDFDDPTPATADVVPMELPPEVIAAEAALITVGHTPAPPLPVDEALPPPAVSRPPFVTETMAELYLAQGFREQALAVYVDLLAASPDDQRLAAIVESLAPVPEADAGPNVRDFFARMAGRRPGSTAAAQEPPAYDDFANDEPVADPAELVAVAAPESPEPVQELTAVAADAPADVAPALARAAATQQPDGSIDALFGNRGAGKSEDSAAAALAQAFGGGADVSSPPPIRGRPAHAAKGELSLDSVFRDGPTRSARTSQSFSFDQFFAGGEERAARTSPPRGVATPPEGQATPAERGADDIEQFNSWLQGLKQR